MNNNLYEWLKDYQQLENRINYLEYQIDKTKMELSRWRSDLSDVRLEANSRGAKVEQVIDKLESDLAFEIIQKQKLLKLIYTFNGLDQEILRKKYIEGMTLEGISFELNYNYGYIKRRHSDLKRTIQVLDEWVK
ncbi:hypothetical protein AB6878_11850 [Carnobacterium maltaromaticum]|uniref:hypothetical protein n=1 Tax=Carnobacterium maltaromaticum TaxID=2751 RepID=UPI0039BEACDB